jgi:hypothetical protein
MLSQVQLDCPRDNSRLRAQTEPLRRIFPGLSVTCSGRVLPNQHTGRARSHTCVVVVARRWRDSNFDPLVLDREVAGALVSGETLTLHISDDGNSADACAATALEVVTRYQRLLPQRNLHSEGALFDRILGVHRALHDLRKPLVAADFDHAMDTWRWVLRLDPEASAAVQIAALFHDVERLLTESEARVEQHAADYRAFKMAHAAHGAALARQALAATGADEALLDRIADLIATHERPGSDPEKLLLNEADALSFFSLNACGFIAYYGLEHTQKKVVYTLDRLGARGRRELGRIRHRADIAALIAEALGSDGPLRASSAEVEVAS